MRPIHALSLVVALAVLVLAAAFFLGRDATPSDVASAWAEVDGVDQARPDPERSSTALATPESDPRSDVRSVPAPQPVARSGTEKKLAAASPSASFRLQARVVGPSGEPVAQATVYAAGTGGMRELPLDAFDPQTMPWMRRVEAQTGPDGRFELALDVRSALRLAVRAAGFAPHDAEIAIAGSERDLGDIVLAPSVILEGHVVDPAGRPVSDAELRRIAEGSAASFLFLGGARGAPVARTDAEGRFRVDQLASGSWRLLITSADHPDKIESGETERPGSVIANLVFTLEAGTEIQGRVVGAPPEMLANLTIRAQPRRGEASEVGGVVPGEAQQAGATWEPLGSSPISAPRRARCNPDGTFTLRGLKAGTSYRLSARDSEREFMARTRTASVQARAGDRGVQLPYKPETALVFQVVDARTGEPITALDVQAGYRWPMPLLDEANKPMRFFPEGRVRFGGFPPRPEGSDGERAQLLVQATGYRTYERKDLVPIEGQDTELGQIRLEPAPLVEVSVLDDASGSPVPGARVVLEEEAPEESDQRRFAFQLGGDDSEERIIGVGSAQRARTDAEGLARVTSLPGRRARITVRSQEHAAWRSEPMLLPIADDVRQTARLQVGGTVVVSVVDAQGAPVAGAGVEHEAPGEEPEQVFRVGSEPRDETDADGQITFAHLVPGVHRFKLRESSGGAPPLRAFRGRRVRGAPRSGGRAPWFEVTVAERASETLRLVAPTKGRLAGTILEGGAPLANATLRLLAPEEDGPQMPSLPMFGGGAQAKTNGKGGYAIEDAETGEYRLSITHHARAMAYETEIEIREGDNEFDVDLAVAVIEGRVTGTDEKPIAGVRVRAERARTGSLLVDTVVATLSLMADGSDVPEFTFNDALGEPVYTDADGRYQLRGVLSDVDLVVKASGKEHQPGESEHARVHPNETKGGVDLVLEPGGTIDVTVVRADGRPGTACVIHARRDGAEPGSAEPKTAFTGGSGSAKLSGLKPGKWIVGVDPVGIGPDTGANRPPDQAIEVAVGKISTARFEIP